MLDELRDLYQEVILDHGRAPRNHGRPPASDREAEGYNPLCGDMLTLYLRLDDEGHITEAAFEGKGCAVSIASASLMTEVVKGRSPAEAERLFENFHGLCTEDEFHPTSETAADADALERLRVFTGIRQFPIRVKCATLAWHTLRAALHEERHASTE